MARKQDFIVGLDLGSDKTCALICRPAPNAKLEVMGLGVAESKGWRKGVIVNLDGAALSVKKAVEEAEAAAGVPVDSAYVGVSGPHIKGVDSRGALSLGNRRREVTHEDLAKAHRAAHSSAKLKVHYSPLVTSSPKEARRAAARPVVSIPKDHAATEATSNIPTRLRHSMSEDNGIVFEPLASAEACLTVEDRELGAALIDIGAGSSGLIVYRERAVQHTAVIPIGGEHFTHDIAVGLRAPVPEAEKMKRAWGARDPEQPLTRAIELPGADERLSSIATYAGLSEILEPRAVELLELVEAELARSGAGKQLGRGVVLCGGGAKLGGLGTLAEQTFGLPVRLGVPAGLTKMGDVLPDPAFATVAGLVAYGFRQRLSQRPQSQGWAEKLWSILAGGKEG